MLWVFCLFLFYTPDCNYWSLYLFMSLISTVCYNRVCFLFIDLLYVYVNTLINSISSTNRDWKVPCKEMNGFLISYFHSVSSFNPPFLSLSFGITMSHQSYHYYCSFYQFEPLQDNSSRNFSSRQPLRYPVWKQGLHLKCKPELRKGKGLQGVDIRVTDKLFANL